MKVTELQYAVANWLTHSHQCRRFALPTKLSKNETADSLITQPSYENLKELKKKEFEEHPLFLPRSRADLSLRRFTRAFMVLPRLR